jgi:cathepsin B
MKFIILAILLVGIFAQEDFIKHSIEVGSTASTWTTTDYESSVFKGWDLWDFIDILGTDISDNYYIPDEFRQIDDYDVNGVPESFDAREEWGDCIHPIRDQMACGSCWAFATSEAFSDRLCILEGVNRVLSPQDLVSCNTFINMGCKGGMPLAAWSYMSTNGLVTDECYPYTSGEGVRGECLRTEDEVCPAEGVTYENYKIKFTTIRYLALIKTLIKKEIMTNGPVVSGFLVYEDFPSYEGGIYEPQTDVFLGGHGVKVKYYLMKSFKQYL